MAIKVPNVGELELLDKMLKDALSVDESYTMKLFKNDVTPGDSDTAGTYTEADFSGYSAKTLTRSGWGAASTVGGVAQSVYTNQTWTKSGATSNTIFGYYVIGTTSTTLLWAERLSSSVALALDGSSLTITPTFTLRSQN